MFKFLLRDEKKVLMEGGCIHEEIAVLRLTWVELSSPIVGRISSP